MNSDVIAEVERVHRLSHGEATLAQYFRNIRRFLAWHQTHAPEKLTLEYREVAVATVKDHSFFKDRSFPLVDSYQPLDLEGYLTLLKNRKKKNQPGESQSLDTSSLSGHRSAFMFLFTIFQRPIPIALQSSLKSYFKGKRRDQANEKRKGNGSVTVGKEPMKFSVYRYLCRKLLSVGTRCSIFAHCYMTISWNLMCRAGNTSTICYEHMAWKEDALSVLFAQMKNDPLGTRPKDPRHLYANPCYPEICCVLALGIYLLCSDVRNMSKMLFPGEKQYDRYSQILKREYSTPDTAQFLTSVGVDPANLGTHSTRKGAATYVTSGTTSAPAMAAIQIRCGWTLEGVQSRYARYENAGDHVVGRTVAGLPVNGPEFAYIPPYFRNRSPAVDAMLKQCFPEAPVTMMGILEHCIASVVYHSSYLQKLLAPNHPIFNTPLFRDTTQFAELQKAVVCVIDDGCQKLPFQTTGIPPYIQQMVAIRRVADEMKSVVPAVVKGVEQLLEARAIDAGSITRQGLQEMMTGMFQSQLAPLLSKLDGQQQTTPAAAAPK